MALYIRPEPKISDEDAAGIQLEGSAMKKFLLMLLAIIFIGGCSKDEPQSRKEESVLEQSRPRVVMETSMGRIVLELFPDVAPNHVKNFLDLIDHSFYNGLTFHRVVKGFVIQGGSPDSSMAGQAGYTIPAEFSNLQHMPGTLAMARGADPNSASCQQIYYFRSGRRGNGCRAKNRKSGYRRENRKAARTGYYDTGLRRRPGVGFGEKTLSYLNFRIMNCEPPTL